MIWTIPAAKILRTTAMRTTARTAAGILRTTAKTAARTVERTKPRTADRITRTGRFPIREAALFSFHGEECIELKRKSAAFPMKQKTFRCGSEHFSHRGARTGDPPYTKAYGVAAGINKTDRSAYPVLEKVIFRLAG